MCHLVAAKALVLACRCLGVWSCAVSSPLIVALFTVTRKSTLLVALALLIEAGSGCSRLTNGLACSLSLLLLDSAQKPLSHS